MGEKIMENSARDKTMRKDGEENVIRRE